MKITRCLVHDCAVEVHEKPVELRPYDVGIGALILRHLPPTGTDVCPDLGRIAREYDGGGVRTVRVVFCGGAAVRVHAGELLHPDETAHECTIGPAVAVEHLIAGKPVSVTEIRV